MKIKQIIMYFCISVCVASYSNVYSMGTDASEIVTTKRCYSYKSLIDHPSSSIAYQGSDSKYDDDDDDECCWCCTCLWYCIFDM